MSRPLPLPLVALLASWALAVAAGACAPDAATEPGPVQQDSAGVEIVTQPAGILEASPEWTLDARPEVRIGTDPGDTHAEFFRIAGVALLGDDLIAVVNSSTAEVRLFDTDGRHVRSVGRSGSGPGEFQVPGLLTTFGRDSLLLYDMGLRRFTVLTAARELRPHAALTTNHAGFAVAATPAGHVLTQRSTATARPDSPEELLSNTVLYGVMSAGDAAGAGAGMEPGDRVFAEVPGQRLLRWNVNGMFGFTPVPFDVAPSAAAGPHGFVIVMGGAAEIRHFAPDGSLVRIVRFEGAAELLPRAAFAAFVDSVVAAAQPENRPELRRRYGLMPPPETAPVFDRALVDDAGDVWLRRAGTPGWVVADPAGNVRGHLTLPSGLTVSTIRGDRILGHRRDELGVERVEVHRLTRR